MTVANLIILTETSLGLLFNSLIGCLFSINYILSSLNFICEINLLCFNFLTNYIHIYILFLFCIYLFIFINGTNLMGT